LSVASGLVMVLVVLVISVTLSVCGRLFRPGAPDVSPRGRLVVSTGSVVGRYKIWSAHRPWCAASPGGKGAV